MEKEQMEALKKEISEVKEVANESLTEEVLLGNSFEFEIAGTTYKVTKPTFGQKQEVYKKRVEKFTQLLQDKQLLLEKDLKKQYKDRGIDIDEMQKKIVELERSKQDLQLKLAQGIIDQISDSELKTFKEQIEKFEEEQLTIAIEKNALMEFSIEQQIFVFVYIYLTYLIAEKKDSNGNWVRVWNKFEDYENEQEEIVKTITYYSSILLKDEIAG